MFFIFPVAFLLGESHSITLRPDNTELALLENTEEKIALKYEVSHINGFDVETEKGFFLRLAFLKVIILVQSVHQSSLQGKN
jgi:hypothetical protein